MATRTIDLDVRVEGTEAAEKSMANLRTQLRLMTEELQTLEAGSERFNELSRAAGELRDTIQDTEEVIRATSGPPLETLSKGLGEATRVGLNGFQAVTGAMAVFGGESEALQATMVKLQGLMAMTQALEALGGLDQSIVKLKSSFGAFFTSAKAGLQGLKGAVAATGIGLLVIAVGTLVAYWDDIKGLVSGVTTEQNKLVELSAENVKAKEGELKALKSSENSLRLQGKSEKDILMIRMEKTKALIKEQEIYIQNLETRAELEIKAAERNQDITQKIIRFGLEASAVALRALAVPIDLALEAANKVSEILGLGEITSFRINDAIDDMIEGAAEWGSSLLFDAEEVRERNKEVIDAEREKLADLKSAYDGYALELKRIDQAATDSALSEAEKRRAERLKILVKEQAETAALEDARRAAEISELTGYQREIAEIEEAGRQKTRDILQAAIADDLEALNDKFLKGKIGEEDYRKEVERITLDARNRLNSEEAELLAINEKSVVDSKKKTNQKWKEEADTFINDIVRTSYEKEQAEAEENFQKSKTKLDTYLKDGFISQEQYNAAIIEITKKRNEALEKLEDEKINKDREKITQAISGIKSAFDSITDDATGFAAKFGSTLSSGILKGFEVFNTEFENTTKGAAEKVSAWTSVIAGTINGLLGAISEGQAVALERNLENVERSFNEEASMLEELRKNGELTEDQYARRRYEIELAAFNKSEELKKAAFEADKGLRISQTIASGAQGAVAAFASAMTIPPPAGQIIGGILAGIMGAMTLANVGIIASQQYGGGTPPQIAQPQLGGGGGVGGQFQQPTGSQLFGTAGLFGNLGGSPQQPGQMQVRAFVVESDITSVQNTISTLEQRAEFG